MEEKLKLLGQISYQLKIFLRELFISWNDNAARLVKKRYINVIDLVDTEILENFQKQQIDLSNLNIEIIRLDEQLYKVEEKSLEIDSLSHRINDSIMIITKKDVLC